MRSRMLAGCLMAVALGSPLGASARAQPEADLGAEAKSRQELDRLLGAWEAKSRTFQTLGIRFDRTDRSQVWGDRSYRGQILFREPNLACVTFGEAKLDAEGKPTGRSRERERLVFTGDEVVQYEMESRQVFIYPAQNPFFGALFRPGSPPFQFLFRPSAAEIREHYRPTLLKQDEEESLIRIVPSRPTDRSAYDQILIWLDAETALPNRIRFFEVGGRTSQEFRFAGPGLGYEPNLPLAPESFQVKVPPGWRLAEAPRMDFPSWLIALWSGTSNPAPEPTGPPRPDRP